ncbi:hypothetical protein ACIQKE_33670 [Streptomyces griseoviridis]
MTASSSVRGLRAAVFAVLCVLLATGGHALATGTAPPALVQVAGCVPVCAAGWLLGGRERSLPAIGAATLTAQGALHALFGAAGRDAMTYMGMPTPGPHPARPSPRLRIPHPHRSLHHLPHPITPHAHAFTPHPLVAHATAAHVLAALLLTWWLRRGEAALWALLRWAVALVPGLVAWWRAGEWDGPVPPDAVRRGAEGPRAPRGSPLRHVVRRRGPPSWVSPAL